MTQLGQSSEARQQHVTNDCAHSDIKKIGDGILSNSRFVEKHDCEIMRNREVVGLRSLKQHRNARKVRGLSRLGWYANSRMKAYQQSYLVRYNYFSMEFRRSWFFLVDIATVKNPCHCCCAKSSVYWN